MIGSDEEIGAAADGRTELLLYDYFKHLTTLSLVALGGVLSIGEGQNVPRDALSGVVLMIGLGGGIALSGLHSIVRGRMAGRPLSRAVKWHRGLSGGAFSIGVGMFLAIFMRSI